MGVAAQHEVEQNVGGLADNHQSLRASGFDQGFASRDTPVVPSVERVWKGITNEVPFNAKFSDIPEALENTVRIAKRCNVKLKLDETHLPQYKVPDGETLLTWGGEVRLWDVPSGAPRAPVPSSASTTTAQSARRVSSRPSIST